MRARCLALVAACCAAAVAAPARGGFDLEFSISDPADRFTPEHEQILADAMAHAEAMWEGVITGYRSGGSIGPVRIAVRPFSAGLAQANFTHTTVEAGYRVATAGFVSMNPEFLESFASGVDPEGNFDTGRNYVDELLAHEAGHVLGIGTLWDDNGAYVINSFEFTGAYALAAYQAEFDAAATSTPVEDAGSGGTRNAHWDQLMRSSSQEGNPADPWSLSPLVGVVDPLGRDRGLELMTGAIDPDFGEPFLSLTTIESMRDLGYTVTSPEDFNGDARVDGDDLAIWELMFGADRLEIDSFVYGDAQRDRDVDGADFLAWQRRAAVRAVPEPSATALLLLGLTGAVRRRRKIGFGRQTVGNRRHGAESVSGR